MCGIAGVIGPIQPSQGRIDSALELMQNRGPDANGIYCGKMGRQEVCLLHSRLSIVDLDPRANQPFLGADCALTFNGEIYNFLEVRKTLQAEGEVFETESDTEVILKAYKKYGLGCFDHLEGMWGLGLLDLSQNRLILSRDRFGEKPLYFLRDGDHLYFGSEIKFLAALSGKALQINYNQVRRYLVNGFRALYKQGSAFFEGIKELPPGTYAVVTESLDVTPNSYWDLRFSPSKITRQEAVEEIKSRLMSSVNLRMRADVPVAFCLSGGVDSSSLASLAVKGLNRNIHTFSIIDGDPRYDESENISCVVQELGCEHHKIMTSTDGFFDRMKALVNYHDSPVATISYYIHSFLSESIHNAGYKVALSGVGADELFTGYYDHYSMWLAEMSDRPDFDKLVSEWRSGYGRFVRNPCLQDPLTFVKNSAERGHLYLNREVFNGFLREPLEEIIEEKSFSSSLLRNRMLNDLFHEIVPVILHEDDLNSMYYSVENRAPFLDRRLAEFMFSIPSDLLIHDGLAKSLLREAVAGYLPDSVRLDSCKRGFNASIESLVDLSDPETINFLLEPSAIFEFVKREAVEGFLKQDMSSNSFSKFLFSFISAKIFLETDLAKGKVG